MKRFNYLVIIYLFVSFPLLANGEDYSFEDLKKISNDKEVVISSFGKRDKTRVRHKYNQNEKDNIQSVFINNLYSFLNSSDSHCELKYIKSLRKDFKKNEIPYTQEEMLDALKMLRITNSIDDILYEILENLTNDLFAFEEIDLGVKPTKNIFKNYPKKSKGYNLNELFSNFKKYPDEISSCSFTEFIRMREKVGKFNTSKSKKNKLLKDLSLEALDENIISLETYNKIKFLQEKSTIQKRSIWLNDYFKIIFSAKNKMIPFKRNYKVINIEDENAYSSERIKRFSNLTRRKVLFQKYDEVQIILLAQVIKKASQRMGVDPDTKTSAPYITQEFTMEDDSGHSEHIIEKFELVTQDQFNLARRLLRRDIVTLQMMKSFQNVTITYQDLVLASLETGYISLDDIDYVVKYDDLWNPETTNFERVKNVCFKLAGYGTFFLPPPWNVTAGLALTVVEGIVESKQVDGASNDNPNTIIE